MVSRAETGVIYFAAVVQGLALATFPAASSIFIAQTGLDDLCGRQHRCDAPGYHRVFHHLAAAW